MFHFFSYFFSCFVLFCWLWSFVYVFFYLCCLFYYFFIYIHARLQEQLDQTNRSDSMNPKSETEILTDSWNKIMKSMVASNLQNVHKSFPFSLQRGTHIAVWMYDLIKFRCYIWHWWIYDSIDARWTEDMIDQVRRVKKNRISKQRGWKWCETTSISSKQQKCWFEENQWERKTTNGLQMIHFRLLAWGFC